MRRGASAWSWQVDERSRLRLAAGTAVDVPTVLDSADARRRRVVSAVRTREGPRRPRLTATANYAADAMPPSRPGRSRGEAECSARERTLSVRPALSRCQERRDLAREPQ